MPAKAVDVSRLCACAALVAMSAFAAVAATDSTWTGTPLTASSTSIRTDGTLKYAYARGTYTANGVEFTGVGSGIINNSNCIVWEASGEPEPQVLLLPVIRKAAAIWSCCSTLGGRLPRTGRYS